MLNRIPSKSDEGDARTPLPGEEEALVPLESASKAVETVEKVIEDEKQLVRDIYEKYLRLYDDFENYRKRTAKEIESLTIYANEVLIGEILPFIDNLERAVKFGSLKKNDPAWAFIAGVQLALKDLLRVLEKHGLEPIGAVGRSFDPNLHDAVTTVQTASHPPNTVIEELRKGYLLNHRLLRPSRVVVALAPEAEFDREPESA